MRLSHRQLRAAEQMTVTKLGPFHYQVESGEKWWTVHYNNDPEVWPPDRWTITNNRGQSVSRWNITGETLAHAIWFHTREA